MPIFRFPQAIGLDHSNASAGDMLRQVAGRLDGPFFTVENTEDFVRIIFPAERPVMIGGGDEVDAFCSGLAVGFLSGCHSTKNRRSRICGQEQDDTNQIQKIG